jgi:hypothetical protein
VGKVERRNPLSLFSKPCPAVHPGESCIRTGDWAVAPTSVACPAGYASKFIGALMAGYKSSVKVINHYGDEVHPFCLCEDIKGRINPRPNEAFSSLCFHIYLANADC